MRSTSTLILTLVLGVAVAGGWYAYAKDTAPAATAGSEIAAPDGTGPLDGMVFVGMLGPSGKPKDVHDRFVFAKGTFVSEECELRCKYPARPYFVRTVAGKTAFVSETQCPHKDAKIVWRGTVDGDRIKGQANWTVRRWYWTIEKTFEFEGKLLKQSAAVEKTR